MTRSTLVLGLIACAALLQGAPVAHAQPRPDDARTCAKETGPAAIESCRRAIASRRFGRNELAMLHYRRAVLRREVGDLDDAIADLDAAIHLNGDAIPTSADAFDLMIVQRNAFALRGRVFADKNDLVRALADVEALLKTNARDTRALALRAEISARQGDCARAIADFDAIVAIDAKAWDGYLGRARCLATLGERDRALADYRVALAGGAPDAVKPQILAEMAKLGGAP